MKKILIATTALVAFAGAANAAEPIKLTVGGYAEQWVGYADQDTELNKFDVQSDSEIHFKGSTKLDNGLTVAVTVEAEAGQGAGNSSVDESYITVSGGFGALIVGQQDNVGEIIHNASPDVGIGNQDGDFFHWVIAPSGAGNGLDHLTTTYADNDGDADKIIYVTPAFYGIQAGVSYTPDTGSNGDQALPGSNETNDLWVGGFAYSGKFGGVTVKADIGAGQWNIDDVGGAGNSANVAVYQGGLNVGYAGFTLGGSYLKRDLDVAAGSDDAGNAWDIGVSYETGPYAVSLTYFDSTNGEALGDLETTSVMLSGAYTMGPGVAAKASLFKVDYEAPGVVNDNDGWGFVTGLRLDF